MCLGAVLSRLVEDKRVRLDRNPHFYEKFPSREDGNIISLDLIQQLDTLGSTQNRWLVLYILTDRKSCVFFKCNIPYRVFGNVWDFGGKIIMKGRYILSLIYPFLNCQLYKMFVDIYTTLVSLACALRIQFSVGVEKSS